MAGEISARDLARRLVGRTIPTIAHDEPNAVLDLEGANVVVGTAESPDGADVPLRHLQAALDRLVEHGEVRINPETFNGFRRFSFLGAALAQLDGVETTGPPTWVRLADSELRPALEAACGLTPQDRGTPAVSTNDPLYGVMSTGVREAIEQIVGDGASYKCKGSAGELNTNWAETPWAAVFDRTVTETAREGYYVVFLVRSDGTGVYLSLNQATTAIRRLSGGSRYLDVLADQASTYAAYLPSGEIEGLTVGALDLEAAGVRSRGYEAGNVVAKFYPGDAIPHDAVLAEDLRRFLRLYARLVEALDGIEVENNPDAPSEAKAGTEAKRYRWHLRAEGRNAGVVKRAKQQQGYVCAVCGLDFEEQYGSLGRRSIDAHHKKPFSELDERPTQLDPIEDFDIVCSNHHRMLHSETPPLTVEQLRERLGQA